MWPSLFSRLCSALSSSFFSSFLLSSLYFTSLHSFLSLPSCSTQCITQYGTLHTADSSVLYLRLYTLQSTPPFLPFPFHAWVTLSELPTLCLTPHPHKTTQHTLNNAPHATPSHYVILYNPLPFPPDSPCPALPYPVLSCLALPFRASHHWRCPYSYSMEQNNLSPYYLNFLIKPLLRQYHYFRLFTLFYVFGTAGITTTVVEYKLWKQLKRVSFRQNCIKKSWNTGIRHRVQVVTSTISNSQHLRTLRGWKHGLGNNGFYIILYCPVKGG
jgi:hypothetical protein